MSKAIDVLKEKIIYARLAGADDENKPFICITIKEGNDILTELAKLPDLEVRIKELEDAGNNLLSVLGPTGYFPSAGKPKTDAFRAALAKGNTNASD